MKLNRLVGVALAATGSLAFSGCFKPALTPMCQPRVASPNKVSLIFRAENPETGEPMTDLIGRFKKGPKLVDGSVSTGLESMPKALQRPGSIAMRTLVLLDGSGSLADAESQAQIKRAVTAFIRKNATVASEGRAIPHTIGIYKFRGDSKILPIFPFSPERERSLSRGLLKLQNPTLSERELDRQVTEARARDTEAMINAVQTDRIGLAGTSTNLFDAIKSGVGTIAAPSAVQDFDRAQITTRTLIVFTDGREEASDTFERRQSVFQVVNEFKSQPDNRVFMVGVKARGVSLDKEFLREVASRKGFVQRRIEDLELAFDEFAERAIAQTQKFYQLNFCSNRRGGTRSVSVHFKKWLPPMDWSFSFDYDASRMTDPTEDNACDPEASDFPTCDLQGEALSAGGPLDRSKMDMHWGHSCAVVNGRVQCWGANDFQQAGGQVGPIVSQVTEVPGTAGAQAVTVGNVHTCALISGSVACWGRNADAQLGVGAAFGNQTTGTPMWVTAPSGAGRLTGIRQIGAGNFFTCALAESGEVYCWGSGPEGQLGSVATSDPKRACPINGNVRTCSVVPVQVAKLPGPASSIAVGATSTCAVVGDRGYCWGSNRLGELSNGDYLWAGTPVPLMADTGLPLSGIRRITAEWDHFCALTNEGVSCWGLNGSGQVGIPATDPPNCEGYAKDRKSACVRVATAVPAEKLGSGGVRDVWVGGSHTCVLQASGQVFCWGDNLNAQLGVGYRNAEDSPLSAGFVKLPSEGPFTGVATSLWGTCLRQAWQTWCWGASGEKGELAPILAPNRVTTDLLPLKLYW
jgi:alpha-tubulin suppressor-like RCC1 family protein